MSPRSPKLSHLAAAATLVIGLAFAPVSLSAQTPAARYTAELASPSAEARVIAGGVVWTCEGTRCSAPVSGARALRMCRDLNRKVGQIVRFDVAGTAIEAADLTRCNG